CGAANADEAVYCLKCGTLLESEEETRVIRRPAAEVDDEAVIFSTTPTLRFVYMGYIAAAVAALLLAAFFSIFFPGVATWLVVLFGLSLLLIPAFYHLRQKLVRYTLMDT